MNKRSLTLEEASGTVPPPTAECSRDGMPTSVLKSLIELSPKSPGKLNTPHRYMIAIQVDAKRQNGLNRNPRSFFAVNAD